MYARYTVVLKDLMDNKESFEKISTSLSTYPLYEPKSEISGIPNRSELNKRLLNAYKYREIGFETVGRFLDELEMTMCEIMPYYNEMYKTIEIMAGLDNPFDNVDFTESFIQTKDGSSENETSTEVMDESSSDTDINTNSSSTTEGASKNVHSQTPGGQLSITAKDIDSVDYADDVNWNSSNDDVLSDSETKQKTTGTNKSNSDSSGHQSMSEKTEHTFTKKGNQGVNTYAHDMIEFRESIIDVTNQIINDERISELFMRVF